MLAVGAGSVVLMMITFWNVELANKTKTAAMRSEASSLALTVAPLRVADDENAAVYYDQAFPYMIELPDKVGVAWVEALDAPTWNADDTALKDYLTRSRRALALLRRGAAQRGCHFERDYSRPSADMLLPELAGLKQAGRLLCLSARQRAQTGDVRGALADLDAALSVARHTASESLLISILVGVAIERVALQTLQALMAAPDVATAGKAWPLPQLDAPYSHRRSMRRAMQMEEAFGLTIYADIASARRGSDLFMLVQTVDAERTSRQMIDELIHGLADPVLLPLWRVFLMDADLASYRAVMASFRERLSQPYVRVAKHAQARFEALERDLDGPLASMIVPALNKVILRSVQAEARRRLAQLGLALTRHRARHDGALPASLDALDPSLIPGIPIDPYTGKPLLLKVGPTTWTLYSVGPDGVDDGGKPLDPDAGLEGKGDLIFTLGR